MSLSARFTAAFAFSAELHARQKRKSTAIPYMAHLMAVCALVLEHGGDEDEGVAALLHDALEDQAEHWGGPEQMKKHIRDRFGEKVLQIVQDCTDADAIPKPPWKRRKTAYLERLTTAPPGTLRVSAADKLHNARSILSDLREIGPEVWDRFTAPKDDQLWYYKSLVQILKERAPCPALVAELERVVDEIERLSDLGES